MRISLRALRVNAELSRKEASKIIGVSVMTLYNWESGKTKPPIDKLQKLAEIYKVGIEVVEI